MFIFAQHRHANAMTLTVIFIKLEWRLECSALLNVKSVVQYTLLFFFLSFLFCFFGVYHFIDVISLMECSLMNVCFHNKSNAKMEHRNELLVRPTVEHLNDEVFILLFVQMK